MNLIELKNVPIFEQLHLEETLLRACTKNYCIINHGSPRAIVMGVSGKPEELLNLQSVQAEKIPVIKRFSGGGTVVIDENTLFVTFIFSKDFLNIPAFPEPILRWTESLYSRAWQIPHFQLRENDYCIGDLKCGGNAQYIRKDRWLHHTSFLWDYAPQNMGHLLLPMKQPKYRQSRSHDAFLTRLRPHRSIESLIQDLKQSISHFGESSAPNVKQLYIWDFLEKLSAKTSARQSTQQVNIY